MLCCAVLCCAVLYCAVLYCAVLYCTVLCCALLCSTVLCCAMLRCAAPFPQAARIVLHTEESMIIHFQEEGILSSKDAEVLLVGSNRDLARLDKVCVCMYVWCVYVCVCGVFGVRACVCMYVDACMPVRACMYCREGALRHNIYRYNCRLHALAVYQRPFISLHFSPLFASISTSSCLAAVDVLYSCLRGVSGAKRVFVMRVRSCVSACAFANSMCL